MAANIHTRAPPLGFNRLSNTVSVYSPPETNGHIGGALPSNSNYDLILFCSWMGAAPKHIAKYTVHYQKHMPNTPILLIESRLPDILFISNARQVENLQPAVEVIRTTIKTAGGTGQNDSSVVILLHVFSNGGCNSSIQLARAWRAATGSNLPLMGMVLDSCPGKGSLRRTVAAISQSLPPSRLLRLLMRPLIWMMLIFYSILTRIRREDFIKSIREGLNDGRNFDRKVPRVYLYSKVDKMVDWRDVEMHVAEAKTAGYEIMAARFEKSPHVAHITEDAGKYWDAVDFVGKMRR